MGPERDRGEKRWLRGRGAPLLAVPEGRCDALQRPMPYVRMVVLAGSKLREPRIRDTSPLRKLGPASLFFRNAVLNERKQVI